MKKKNVDRLEGFFLGLLVGFVIGVLMAALQCCCYPVGTIEGDATTDATAFGQPVFRELDDASMEDL